MLKKIVSENHKINAEAGNLDALPIVEQDKIFAKTQGFLPVREMVNMAIVGFGEYDYYKVNTLDGTNEVGVYEKRVSALEEWIEEEGAGFTEKEKQFLIQRWEDLETPFYYEYAAGWIALLSDSQIIPTLLCILVAIIGIFISGIFSDEYINKSDSIFFSTKFGRSRAVLAKVETGFLVTTIVYWGAILMYTLMVLGILGFGGANVPIQLVNWKSMYNFTFIQEYFVVVLGGYIGSLFILTVAMFVSAKSRSSVMGIVTAFVLSCVPMFLGRITLFSKIINFFPDIMFRMTEELDQFLIYDIGGKIMGLFEFLIPVYLVLYLLILPVLYQVYRRAEVK